MDNFLRTDFFNEYRDEVELIDGLRQFDLPITKLKNLCRDIKTPQIWSSFNPPVLLMRIKDNVLMTS